MSEKQEFAITPEDPAAPESSFDAAAMRERYRIEREKRQRPDGNDQYIEMKGEFARFDEDPYVVRIEREPIDCESEAVVIGGGFGGLLAAARLREAGVDDIRIIEKGGDFGGTWYWNRYPGAQCDIESYIYLPLLEETGYLPKEKYSHGPEILEHSRRIGRHFDLYESALFQTEVREIRWDESIERWVVSTDRSDRIRARFVAMATGPLQRSKLPGIPGILDFRGHMFHTSRWDYEYTGGSSEGGLDKLGDKRVAVIGTGATAIQAVPFLGEAAKHLYVFQRTPSGVDVRGNRPTDPEWAATLEPGWQRYRMENFNRYLEGIPQEEEDLVNDAWTDLIRKVFRGVRSMSDGELDVVVEMANFEKMNEIRARVDEIVDDPEVAEKLKPYYKLGCKRPCFHDDYLPTFNRPNVTLVDTDGLGVERITERGLVVGGVEYEIDCLIFATGFEVGTAYRRRAGYDVIGRGGMKLSEKWAGGMATLHGMQSHGFPNCFFLSNSQAGGTANFPHLLDEATRHISHIVRHVREQGFKSVDVTRQAEEAWVEVILSGKTGLLGDVECTPGYYNGEGKVDRKFRSILPYPAGANVFFELLAKWRAAGTFDGLEFSARGD